MAVAPLEIRIAFDHGHAQFRHEPLEIPIPPGAPSMLISFAPVRPALIWQYYLWTFGAVVPAGPTSKLYFKHWQEGVVRHDDPMVHSLLDFEYPVWANATLTNPHYIECYNLTGQTQTIDLQLWLAEFPTAGAYIDWYCDLIILGLRCDIAGYILKAMELKREEFEERLQTRRKVLQKLLR